MIEYKAPFPWFGGKSRACDLVWSVFGEVKNYVEPFAGSAAMLLGAPDDGKRIETINDADGFVSNFWRAIHSDPEAVANYADWPCNENDLFSRHSWLVRNAHELTDKLHADPEYFDAKMAGWWCWGACNWIGSGWCSGKGPWVYDGEKLIDRRKLPHLGDAGQGIKRQLPHLSAAGQGINRKLPHLGDAGQGINRQLPHLSAAGQGINRKLPHLSAAPRGQFIYSWFSALQDRLRNVRVTCGDWSRVVKESVTVRHGLTGVFLDPPYFKGSMDYAAGGVGTNLAADVGAWCAANGDNPKLRIVICGHSEEHDALLKKGWIARKWIAKKGYAKTEAAKANSKSETIWCSPHCIAEINS
jgi:site-specific DNA-adenine methylase